MDYFRSSKKKKTSRITNNMKKKRYNFDFGIKRQRNRSSSSSSSSSSISSTSSSSSSTSSSSTSSSTSSITSTTSSKSSCNSSVIKYMKTRKRRITSGRHRKQTSDRRHRQRERTDLTPDDPQPLTFHRVHGKRLKISGNGSEARRTRLEFYEGEAYSARPIRINEKVYFRIVEISDSWTATVNLGFINQDPATLAHSTPSRSTKYWVLSLKKRFCVENAIMYYYVNSAGDVYFGVDGEDKALIFSKIDTSSPLWAIVNIDGKNSAIQLMNTCVLDQGTNPNQYPMVEDICSFSRTARPLPQLKYQKAVKPLNLHKIKAKSVHYCSGVVCKTQGKVTQVYAFSAQPIFPSQSILIQLLAIEKYPAGKRYGFAYGLTSCDPATLRQCDLLDNAEQLLGRDEYWYIRKFDTDGLRSGLELTVTLTVNGDILESRENCDPGIVEHVHNTNLWVFVELHAVSKLRLMITRKPRNQGRTQPSAAASSQPGRVEPSTSYQPHPQPSDPETEVSSNNQPPQPNEPERMELSSSNQPHPQPCEPVARQEQNSTDSECKICYERPIDCALIKCGHMCMCYLCALQVSEVGDRLCPICRARIKSVIRIYKS